MREDGKVRSYKKSRWSQSFRFEGSLMKEMNGVKETRCRKVWRFRDNSMEDTSVPEKRQLEF